VLILGRKFKKKSTAVNTNELDIYVAFNPNPAYGVATTPNWQNENRYDYIQDPQNVVKMTHNPSYGVTGRNDTSVNSNIPVTPNIEMNESHYEYITKGKNKLPHIICKIQEVILS